MKILLFIMWIEQNVHFFEKNYFISNKKLKSSMNGEWFSYKLVVRILESSNIREVPWMESVFILLGLPEGASWKGGQIA